MPPTLDTDFARSAFPAFSEPAFENRPFFENAGGSYACGPVIERLECFYRTAGVQPYGPFPASAEAGRMMDEGRTRLAALLNIPVQELSVGPSTSQNTYVLACALAHDLRPGDEIIVTNQDHEANSGCWRRLAETGAVIHEWKIDPDTGLLDIAGLESLLGPRTRFVAFPHCSNIVGHFNDIERICRLVHDAGALAVVDGVSFAPHGLPDIAATGADVYLFSTYKTYGPHQGIMMIRHDLLEQLSNQGHWFNESSPDKRLVPAGPDHAQVAALAGIADYWDMLHAHHFGETETPPPQKARDIATLFRDHEKRLMEPLLEFLSECDDARLIGPDTPEGRAPTIALDTRHPPLEIAEDLAELGIMAGAGDFYAVRTLQALGIDPKRGVLRLSFVHYTTEAEIDQLIAALETVL